MTRIVLKSKVGADGILHVDIPLSDSDANRDVQITVEPAANSPAGERDWDAIFSSTAGKWQGELERPEQGEYEVRDELP